MHRAPEVRRVLANNPRLSVHRMLSYAPKLNAVESMWSNAKSVKLRGIAAHDPDYLNTNVGTALSFIAADEALMRSFFRDTPLQIPGVT